jgi:hypothetical protein
MSATEPPIMKDTDLRGLILKKYYDKRREGWVQWKSEDFHNLKEDFTAADLFAVCSQLGENGLIEWRGLEDNTGRTIDGRGKITAFGVEVAEGTAVPPIAIHVDNSDHSISLTSSSNVQVGNNNSLDASIHIRGLVEAIDRSVSPIEKKQEARGALKRFLEHPTVASILGGLAGNL